MCDANALFYISIKLAGQYTEANLMVLRRRVVVQVLLREAPPPIFTYKMLRIKTCENHKVFLQLRVQLLVSLQNQHALTSTSAFLPSRKLNMTNIITVKVRARMWFISEFSCVKAFNEHIQLETIAWL